MPLEDSVYFGENVLLVCRDDACSVYKLQDKTGEGMMTSYTVFPGINLLYHDFHLDCCMSYFQSGVEIFCIDHCREGRLEWEMSNGSCLYMGTGDLQMDSRSRHCGMFKFPLRHYHGITVSICMDKASDVLSNVLEGFTVDIGALREKFCRGDRPFIIRAGASIEHIFSELYSVPDVVRIPFFKIKVLELLLFLSTLEVPPGAGERPYFYKTQVEKTKAIMALITSRLERHYTLEELSSKFDFPVTSMKNCFKGVYGTSIYAYIKSYRMNTAALRLRQTKDNITSIALQMGYNNASKFSAAFEAVIGMTPSEYRKSIV